MDGILARDLQLRPSSKFAYLLRPLPTRAAQLDSYAQYYRRRILRVVSVSKAAKRCLPAPAEPHLTGSLPVLCMTSSALISSACAPIEMDTWGLLVSQLVH